MDDNNYSCEWSDFSCSFDYLVNEIQVVFISMFHTFMGKIAGIFEAIPAPDFIGDMQSFQLPDFFLYLADILQIYAGLGIVMGAYLVRFIIRRLPVIG